MESNNHDALETVLESALRSYSQAEPLAGLEERILNRTRAVKVKRGTACLRPLAFTGLVAVLGISLFVFMRSGQLPTPKTSAVAINQKPSAPSLSSLKLPVRSARLVSTSRRRPTRQRVTKREQFPIPEPLTAEERTLVRFVDHDPKRAAEDFASLQRNTDAPIVIQPLQITPLQVDGPTK